ncbi:hypothetical protein H5T51_00685, partial [Candidatus Bathyarchaeota archaeon]|nr:hypothetical protein [Candidatus Bathyarchaeota archaeon]
LEISRSRGESIGKFVEDAVRLAIKASNIGLTSEEVGDIVEVLHLQRVLGGAFIPQGVLDYVMSSIYKAGKNEFLEKWFESGKLHGRYLKERFKNPVDALRCFLEATRWDLNEVDVIRNENCFRLRCVSTAMSMGATEMLCRFLQGIIIGIGCNITNAECLKGLVIIDFKS